MFDLAGVRRGVNWLMAFAVCCGLLALVTATTADAQQAAFRCASDAGELTWSDDEQSKYWAYKSTDGGLTFVWFGRTLGSTALTDPAPAPGTMYQVHYDGIDRVDCTVTSEPTDAAEQFWCEAGGGVITWSDHQQDKYWVYRSDGDGATYRWLGRTLGSTSLTDPATSAGALYQVHYEGIPRTACSTTVSAALQAPFVANPVPGVVQAEDFDLGGPGVAFFDSDPKIHAADALYRTDDVDIYANVDPAPAGLSVGRNRDGEWLEYTVDVASGGDYDIDVRVASGHGGTPGQLTVLVDGIAAGSTAVASNGWWVFDDQRVGSARLEAGKSVVRLEISGAADVGLFNIDSFRISPQPQVHGPVVGGPYPLGLTSLACDSSDGRVQWSDQGAATYWLYRSSDGGGSWTLVVASTGLAATDADWSAGDVYQVRSDGVPAVDCVFSNGPVPSAGVAPAGNGAVELFEDIAYGGAVQSFDHGDYWTYAFHQSLGGFGNNAMSSLKVADGTTAIVCDLENGSAPCLVAVGPVGLADLGSYNFDNRMTYLQVQPSCSPFVVTAGTDSVMFEHLLPDCGGLVSATPTPVPPTPTTVPPTPTPLPVGQFTCSFTNTGSISWSDAGDIGSNYWIYKSTNGGLTFSFLKGLTPGTTSYTDTTYQYGDVYEVGYTAVPRAVCDQPPAPPAPTATPTPQPAPVRVFAGTGFSGSSVSFDSGVYTNFGAVGDNNASSLQVAAGYVALLCPNASGTGTCKHFIVSKSDLGDFTFDNRASYLQVRRASDALTVEPANSLFSFVNASPENTKFDIRPGVHDGRTLFPKTGMQFIGARDSNGDRPRLDGRGYDGGFSDARSPVARNVVIKGLELTGYRGNTGNAVVFARESIDWTITDNDIHDNDVPGIAFGQGARITNNRFVRNDLIAISGHDAVSDWVIDGNYFENNNPNRNEDGFVNWRFGDIKVVYATDGRISNNTFRNSDNGYAIYLDDFATRVLVENNDIQGDFTTFFIEFGVEDIVVRNNTVTVGERYDDGTCRAFLIRNVVSVLVENNTIIIPNGVGCTRLSKARIIELQDRTSGFHGDERFFGSMIVRSNHVTNNSSRNVAMIDTLGRNLGTQWRDNTYNRNVVVSSESVNPDEVAAGWRQGG